MERFLAIKELDLELSLSLIFFLANQKSCLLFLNFVNVLEIKLPGRNSKLMLSHNFSSQSFIQISWNYNFFQKIPLPKPILFRRLYRFLRYLAFPLLFYVNKIVSWTRYCKPHQWSVCKFANIWTLFTLNIQILRQFNSRDGIYIYFSKTDLENAST